VDLFDCAILSQQTAENSNLWRYASENRSSPRVVIVKWLLANENRPQGSKIKTGPINKLKTVKRAMNWGWLDQRQDREIQNMCI
jgi:hypothetical protein